MFPVLKNWGKMKTSYLFKEFWLGDTEKQVL